MTSTLSNRRVTIFSLALLLFSSIAWARNNDHLEPCDGEFSSSSVEPYHLAVRSALLGEHNYRICQMVAIPSFQREWAVYIVNEKEGPPNLIFKSMRKHLWSQMSRIISDDGKKTSYDLDEASQASALKQLKFEVETSAVQIKPETAELLGKIWSKMLAGVRYPDTATRGLDGVQYHVSHWAPSEGFRSGTIWSPDPDSPLGSLVHLADSMKNLAQASVFSRKSAEGQVVTEGRALLARLDAQK